MLPKITVLETKRLSKGKNFEVVRERLQIGGRETERDTVVHPGASVFIPQLASGELLLTYQYRHPLKSMLLEFPAGTLDPGEQPLACAKREIQEEVGYEAQDWTDLGTLLPAPGFCSEVQYCYLARTLTPSRLEMDEDEIIEVRTMTVSEVEGAIKRQEIRDAKSVALFFRARLLGLL